MILFISVALLPIILAQEEVPCDSCCRLPKTAPDGDAVTLLCSNISEKIQRLKNAINLSSCGKGTEILDLISFLCQTLFKILEAPYLLKKLMCV